MKLLATLAVLLLPALALAAESGHNAGNEIPKTVIYQAINVIILVGGLIYFTKDAIVAFFGGRKTTYLEQAQKAAFAREQAEREFVDIKHKIATLDQTRAEAIAKAQAHAQDMQKQIMDEASAVSKRIQDDAQLTAKLEVARAQRELREELLKSSVEAARIVLTKDISANDQQKLQTDFVKNIEVSAP
jgi:F-type H+-transporting ATPase subunit b